LNVSEREHISVLGLACYLAFMFCLVACSNESATISVNLRPPVTPTPIRPPTEASPGYVWISPIDEMPLVYIPEGSFLMGTSTDDLQFEEDETPQREIYLDAFWIDQLEITNRMFTECVDNGSCEHPSESGSQARTSYYDNLSFAEYPVVNVNWEQAQTYCSWVGRRLPTEAEWEKAARGTQGQIYPWGNQEPTCELLNIWESETGSANCARDTTLVGKYPNGASPYGVLDMAGNVWEWVADWYNVDSYKVGPDRNPQGANTGDARVIRGGSFSESGDTVRSANRNQSDPFADSYLIGFRCALSAGP